MTLVAGVRVPLMSRLHKVLYTYITLWQRGDGGHDRSVVLAECGEFYGSHPSVCIKSAAKKYECAGSWLVHALLRK